MYQIFVIQIVFQSSDRAELEYLENRFEFQVLIFSPKGPATFKFWEMKLLLLAADFEYAKIFRFALLDTKLWQKDDGILYQF